MLDSKDNKLTSTVTDLQSTLRGVKVCGPHRYLCGGEIIELR